MFRRKKNGVEKVTCKDYKQLCQKVNEYISNVLRENPYEKVRSQTELEGNLKFRKDLRKAIKNCVVGDYDAKIFIRDFIKEILVFKLKLTEEALDTIFHFRSAYQLSSRDKFSIMLYKYEVYYQEQALKVLFDTYELSKPKVNDAQEIYYEVTDEEIADMYQREGNMVLSYVEKIHIVAQRIYEDTKGNGPIDMLLSMALDGISGGVSGSSLSVSGFQLLEGKEYAFQSIWIFFQGKSIYLSFLKFQTEKEFVRICKNLYRYQNPGQLSQMKGYIVNEMADGSRVAVARPPFCENWVFFIRKFNSVYNKNMDELLTDENKIFPIQLLKWLIKGCQILAITGEQGSGKTTLLMSLVHYMKPTYNLRVQELAFELHLRKIYPNRNIVSFRETQTISGQEGLDFQKKTDGTVNILGEVASNEVCSWLIQMAQVASLFTLFTHHAKTTKDLIFSFRNALLLEGGFSEARIATEQVIHVLNFDVHMRKAEDGHRYIERISEIIERPFEFSGHTDKMFEIRDLLLFVDGAYQVREMMSERTQSKILEVLGKEEKEEFLDFLQDWREQCNNEY